MKMTLMRINKLNANPLAGIHNDFDEMFGSLLGSFRRPMYEASLAPAIDVVERDGTLVIKAEVPGCKPEDIDISINDGVLSISGEKKQEEETDENGFHHYERSYGSFTRSIRLPENVDLSSIQAACTEGVLSVTMTKTEEEKPLKIEVKNKK
jgi:HSP20 family protein